MSSNNAAISDASARLNRRAPVSFSHWAQIAAFILPALALFLIFVIVPMIEAVWYSFYKWNGYGPITNFIGLNNYILILSDPVFRHALLDNFLIIMVSIFVQIPLAIWLATIVAKPLRGMVFFRALFFLPYVLADVAAGVIWHFVYDGNYGVLAGIAQLFGQQAPFILGDRTWAIYGILLVIVWKFFGFHMMLFLAALQGMDKSLVEAAQIDGASSRQLFRHLTLPLLRPTIALSVFFSIIGSLQTFDTIMALTSGGPSNSTQTMVTYLYIFGAQHLKVSFGTAAGVVLFLMSAIFAFVYRRLAMREEK